MYGIAARGIVLAVLLLGGTACTNCRTFGKVEFSSAGGQSDTYFYRGRTFFPVLPFPAARGAAGCWAGLGAHWVSLTWSQPDLWLFTGQDICEPECWEPGFGFGGC
jgi:hypothetical protein